MRFLPSTRCAIIILWAHLKPGITAGHTAWTSQVEKEDDGTLSVYEAPPFSEAFRFVKRGPAAEIISHYDVSGSMWKFFKR